MITGLIFGFFTEYLLGNTKIYDNAVDRATMRRLSKSAYWLCLDAKLKEDEKIGLLKDKKKNKANEIYWKTKGVKLE